MGNGGVRIFLGLMLGAMFVWPAAAIAAPGWSASTTVLPAEAEPTSRTEIGFDSSGRETVAWIDLISSVAPYETELKVGTRMPGQPLSNDLTVKTRLGPDRVPVGVSLDVAPNGAAVICLSEALDANDPTAGNAQIAYYRQAGSSTWSAPAPISETTIPTNSSNSCNAYISENGSAAVVTTTVTETAPPPNLSSLRGAVVVMTHPANGGWGTAETISDSDRLARYPQAAFDGDGNLSVIWWDRWQGNDTPSTGDDRHTVKYRSRSATSGFFGITTDVAGAEGQASRSVYSPRLGLNDSGKAVVAWQESTAIHASVRETGVAPFSAPTVINNSGSSSSPGAAGVAPNGTVYVTGSQTGVGSANDISLFIRKPVGEPWQPATTFGTPGTWTGVHTLRFSGNDALLVTRYGVNTSPNDMLLTGIRWQDSEAVPDALQALVPTGSRDDAVTFVSDHQGALVLTHKNVGMLATTTQMLAWDAAPPRNESLSIPTTAAVNYPVALKATFSDRWSPPATANWDFGDGNTAGGDSVSHTWKQAGEFTVTVTGTDNRGNQRTISRQIRVGKDTVKPLVKIADPTCGKRKKAACTKFRKTRKAWRNLKGTASDAGGSGVRKVEINLSRKVGKRFEALTGKKIRKGRSAKQVKKAWVKAKLKAGRWSLDVPKSWKPGTWTLKVRAVDAAGNVSKTAKRKLKLR